MAYRQFFGGGIQFQETDTWREGVKIQFCQFCHLGILHIVLFNLWYKGKSKLQLGYPALCHMIRRSGQYYAMHLKNSNRLLIRVVLCVCLVGIQIYITG